MSHGQPELHVNKEQKAAMKRKEYFRKHLIIPFSWGRCFLESLAIGAVHFAASASAPLSAPSPFPILQLC